MYDVCIIGGGINGVSTALQCSKRGYSVILFEQKELANGASSKTSKLAHGGLRYLENLEFSLVRESLQERNKLLESYPHHVKALPFVFPVYNHIDTAKMWLGLKIYDILAKGSKMPASYKTSLSDAKSKVPWLKLDNIKSTFIYFDAVMDDKELVKTIAKQASMNFSEIYTNEQVVEFKHFSNYVDVYTTKRNIQCKALINVTGAWNREMTSPSKGVHLVTNKLKSDTATILINPKDSRVFFTIPFKGNTIIGTTDKLYTDDPNNLSIDNFDRQYIIDAINTFSIEQIGMNDIIDEYVGLRPLAKSSKSVGTISRDFVIKNKNRIFNMVGGKYTTHRLMCETLTNMVEKTIKGD